MDKSENALERIDRIDGELLKLFTERFRAADALEAASAPGGTFREPERTISDQKGVSRMMIPSIRTFSEA